MSPKALIVTIILISLSSLTASERVLGAYIFQQYGDSDQTLPITSPEQGDHEQYLTGRYFHDRYIPPSAKLRIWGIGLDKYDAFKMLDCFTEAQVKAEASNQVIIQPGEAFIRGLYPLVPTETQLNNLLKADTSPRGGFTGFIGEPLEGYVGYELKKLLAKAHVLDTNHPLAIKDSSQDVKQQLSKLAKANKLRRLDESDPRVGGLLLAGRVLSKLNQIINKKSKERLHIEFGSPESLISFFHVNGYDAPASLGSYASTLVWELVTNARWDKYPSKKDTFVRFLAHGGPILSNTTSLTAYPLFQQPTPSLSWKDFDRHSKELRKTSLKKGHDKRNIYERRSDKSSWDAVSIFWVSLYAIFFGIPALIIVIKGLGFFFTAIWPGIKSIKFDCLKRLGQWMAERIEVMVDYMGSGIKLLGVWISVPPKAIFNMSVELIGWASCRKSRQKSNSNDSGDGDAWSAEMVQIEGVKPDKENDSPV